MLVVNCGSSSLKYEVYEMPEGRSLGKGVVERIGMGVGNIDQESPRGEYHHEQEIKDHAVAMELVQRALIDSQYGLLSDLGQVVGVGHRVVHGGESYSQSVVIDTQVLAAIKQNIELAPLHNPANLTGIQESMKFFPGVPQVAVFDTAFHQTIPSSSYLYGLPYELYEKFKIRKYGFHGTSHRYVANEAVRFLKRAMENTNVISAHLGNGASITAVARGKSIDTSMGFTPLEGLVMGTRSGDIDPAIIFYLMERGYSPEELNTLLNKKSGLLGLSGISNDMRDVHKASLEGNTRAESALEVFAHRVRRYIGAYMANLVKVDALIFTGGVGQHAPHMRERICRRLENLGIVMDYEKNRENGSKLGIISTDYSPVTILVVPTNEELQIAKDTYSLVFGSAQA
ncbi:acetate kinase [Spirochaeta lutea]|uniref:Acetate kinase n=1 Tax=Spirochaeta lutea TaxID=1480694 RepID=A0A098QXM6_9SPIO|nr:acetate kinase [Spirochaeta lutea]